MSRINYSDEPLAPSFEGADASERRPVVFTDGTPLDRGNVCPACGTGNRKLAYLCFNCGRWFRKPPAQVPDPDSPGTWIRSCSDEFLLEMAFYTLLGLLIGSVVLVGELLQRISEWSAG